MTIHTRHRIGRRRLDLHKYHLNIEFAAALRACRKEARITQVELAQKLNLGRFKLFEMERGSISDPEEFRVVAAEYPSLERFNPYNKPEGVEVFDVGSTLPTPIPPPIRIMPKATAKPSLVALVNATKTADELRLLLKLALNMGLPLDALVQGT
jgi:transcriptional regulator with XRE-family HTH domain